MNAKPTYISIELLKAGLKDAGYSSENKILGGVNHTLFTSTYGETWLTSNARVSYPSNNGTARNISANKHVAYDLARGMGITVPFTVCLDSDQKLTETLLKSLLAESPLIIKPDNASLSYGLTLHVTTPKQLRQAVKQARLHSEKVLIQKQVNFEEIRFVVIDGRVTAAILRQTPRVVGDGVHTIDELVFIENKQRRQLSMPHLTYPELQEPLIDFSSLDMSVVPENNEVIELARSTMVRGGASMYNVLDQVHESYVQIAKQLADALGNSFTVVDVFIENYRLPQSKTNYAFNEFNSSPVLSLFYSCRDGKHYDVVQDLIALIDRTVSAKSVKHTTVVGNFEYVDMPDFGLSHLLAKVDTGAYSGALDCLDVETIKMGQDRIPGIRFRLAANPDHTIETTNYVRKYVRSATGHQVKRYLITTTISIRGKVYPVTIGLSDRSKLKCPVLIGRRFLRENKMIVDVCAGEKLNQEENL